MFHQDDLKDYLIGGTPLGSRNGRYHLRDAVDELPIYSPLIGAYYSETYRTTGGFFLDDDGLGYLSGGRAIGSLHGYHTYSPQETESLLYSMRVGQGLREITRSGGVFRDIFRDMVITITPETGSLN